MLNDKIPDLIANPVKIRLRSSHFLYKVDLSLSNSIEKNRFILEAEGVVRVGPKKSAVNIQTSYRQQEKEWILESHNLQVSGFGLFEDYSSIDPEPDLIDPLSLLWIVDRELSSSLEGLLLVGNKKRPFLLQKNSSVFELWMKDRLQCSVERMPDQLRISVPKLKIKLSLTIDYSN